MAPSSSYPSRLLQAPWPWRSVSSSPFPIQYLLSRTIFPNLSSIPQHLSSGHKCPPNLFPITQLPSQYSRDNYLTLPSSHATQPPVCSRPYGPARRSRQSPSICPRSRHLPPALESRRRRFYAHGSHCSRWLLETRLRLLSSWMRGPSR